MSYVVCNEDLDYCRDNLNIKWFPEVRIYSSGHFSTFESKELGWSTLSQWLIDSLSQTIQGLGDDKIDVNLKTIFNQKFLEEQVIMLLSGDFTKNQLTTFEGLAKLFPKIHFIRVSQKEVEISSLDS